MNHISITIAPGVIALLGLLLPMATALVTKRLADSAVKAIVLIALSVLVSIVSDLKATGNLDLIPVAWNFLLTFLTAVGMHFGLLQPLRVTGSAGLIQRKTGDVGLGSNSPAAAGR